MTLYGDIAADELRQWVNSCLDSPYKQVATITIVDKPPVLATEKLDQTALEQQNE